MTIFEPSMGREKRPRLPFTLLPSLNYIILYRLLIRGILLCADDQNMTVEEFLDRKRANKELDL